MDITKAEEIVKYIKSLTSVERKFVRHILHETAETTIKCREKIKNGRANNKPKRKYRKRKNKRYNDEQIRQAHELKEKGLNNRKISKKTGIRETSLSNTNWLKERLQSMVKIAPDTVDKDMFI